jgi:cell division protein FtsB
LNQVQQFVEKLVAGRRLLASALLALFAVGIFAHVLTGNNGWLSYRRKQAEYQKLQEEIQRTDEENRRLEAEIKALKSDPKAIEKEAREQLRYAKPGEVIYLLPEQPESSNPAAPQEAQRR